MISGIKRLSDRIIEDLERRLPGQRRLQRNKLGLLVATMLEVRSANLMDLAASLPRATERVDMRHQWIERFLANDRVDIDEVMAPFAQEALARVAASDQLAVLGIGQTLVSKRHHILMIGLRPGRRPLPLAWRVRRTRGAIGFACQRELVEIITGLLPVGAKVALMGDRFYGSPELIELCRSLGWGYCLRLKGNLVVIQEGRRTTTGDCARHGEQLLRNVGLTRKRIPTNIAIVRDDSDDKPRIIAMDEAQDAYGAYDDGRAWCIEAMFSDFKTRGFGLEDTQIRYPERLARLILVMALALYWAVSTGMWEAEQNSSPATSIPDTAGPKSTPEA